MAHKYTCEWLYHFTCSDCKNWWSWSLSLPGLQYVQKSWHCPHCGKVNEIQDAAIRDHSESPFGSGPETPDEN